MKTSPSVRLPIALLLLVAASGCATTEIPQFQAFATAGSSYTQAVDGLLTEVGSSAVDANSAKLLETQELTPVTRAQLGQQDQEMRDYLAELERIRTQVDLLGEYFQALASLATSNAPESFSTQVQNVATSLNGVSQQVRGTDIASDPQAAATLAGGVGSLVVKGVQGRALERELRARKETIAEVLLLQQALLKVLSSQAEANARFTSARQYDKEVVIPLTTNQVTSDPARESWMTDRRQMLSQPLLVQQVQAAEQAAASLRQAWSKLLSHDLTAADVQAIAAQIAPILTSLDALKQSQTAAGTGTDGGTGETQP
jgi:hypothetical protein